MLTFIKKNKTSAILISILLVLIFVNRLTREKPETPVETEPVKKQANYQNLTPGTSTKDQTIEKLGNPVKEEGNGTILKFTSSAQGKPHEVLMEENIVFLIIETVTLNDQKTVSDVKKEFGEPKDVLYGPRYTAGFNLYVYPKNGIAYVGQNESDVLLEVWYFPPTTLEDFNMRFAPKYTETPPSQEGLY